MSDDTHLDLTASLAAARDGDLAGLGPALDVMFPYLIRVARAELPKGTGDRFSPLDVVQEAFLMTLAEIGQFHGRTEGKLRTWMAAVVRHQACDEVKRRFADKRDARREVALKSGDDTPDQGPGSFLDGLVRSEDKEILREALGRLPDEDRLLIELWSNRQRVGTIATGLGISPAATQKRISRALVSLRDEVGRSEGNPNAGFAADGLLFAVLPE